MVYSFWEVRHDVSTHGIRRFGGLNSLILNQAVKGGIISVIYVLVLIAAIFSAFLRALRKGGGIIAVSIAAGLVSFMGHQIFDNVLRFPTVNSFFWFVTGLLLALATLGLSSRAGLEPVPKRLFENDGRKIYDAPSGRSSPE